MSEEYDYDKDDDKRVSKIPLKCMFGIPELIERLQTSNAQTIITIFEDSEGEWYFMRTILDGGQIMIRMAELGAVEKMKLWLNDIHSHENAFG